MATLKNTRLMSDIYRIIIIISLFFKIFIRRTHLTHLTNIKTKHLYRKFLLYEERPICMNRLSSKDFIN